MSSTPAGAKPTDLHGDIQVYLQKAKKKEPKKTTDQHIDEYLSNLGKSKWGRGRFITYRPDSGLRIEKLNILGQIRTWFTGARNFSRFLDEESTKIIKRNITKALQDSPSNKKIVEKFNDIVANLYTKEFKGGLFGKNQQRLNQLYPHFP